MALVRVLKQRLFPEFIYQVGLSPFESNLKSNFGARPKIVLFGGV